MSIGKGVCRVDCLPAHTPILYIALKTLGDKEGGGGGVRSHSYLAGKLVSLLVESQAEESTR